MEAKPSTHEYTVRQCAAMLGVGEKWLFDWLKATGNLTKRNSNYLIPSGEAAANGYIIPVPGEHMRKGFSQKFAHFKPAITAEGFRWLVQEVAKAQLEERKEQNEKAG